MASHYQEETSAVYKSFYLHQETQNKCNFLVDKIRDYFDKRDKGLRLPLTTMIQ